MDNQNPADPTTPTQAGSPKLDRATPPTYRLPEPGAAFGVVLAFLRRSATIFKMAGVVVLILLLLIPLSMVRSVMHERLGRRNEAVADITSSWGRDQKLVGPVLIVPYRYTARSWKEQPAAGGKTEKVEVVDMVTASACFLPTNLSIVGDIKPMQLRRGIYQAVVYTGKLELAGEFA
jgi:inner membrane protein